MADNEFEVKLRGRLLKIPDGGLAPLELGAVINQVEKKIADLEEKTHFMDTSTLAMLAAIEFATELFKLKKISGTANEAVLKDVSARKRLT